MLLSEKAGRNHKGKGSPYLPLVGIPVKTQRTIAIDLARVTIPFQDLLWAPGGAVRLRGRLSTGSQPPSSSSLSF